MAAPPENVDRDPRGGEDGERPAIAVERGDELAGLVDRVCERGVGELGCVEREGRGGDRDRGEGSVRADGGLGCRLTARPIAGAGGGPNSSIRRSLSGSRCAIASPLSCSIDARVGMRSGVMDAHTGRFG